MRLPWGPHRQIEARMRSAPSRMQPNSDLSQTCPFLPSSDTAYFTIFATSRHIPRRWRHIALFPKIIHHSAVRTCGVYASCPIHPPQSLPRCIHPFAAYFTVLRRSTDHQPTIHLVQRNQRPPPAEQANHQRIQASPVCGNNVQRYSPILGHIHNGINQISSPKSNSICSPERGNDFYWVIIFLSNLSV